MWQLLIHIWIEGGTEVKDLEKSHFPLTVILLTLWSTIEFGSSMSWDRQAPHQLSNQSLLEFPFLIHQEEFSITKFISSLTLVQMEEKIWWLMNLFFLITLCLKREALDSGELWRFHTSFTFDATFIVIISNTKAYFLHGLTNVFSCHCYNLIFCFLPTPDESLCCKLKDSNKRDRLNIKGHAVS